MEHGVGDGVVFAVEILVQVGLEKLADGDAVPGAHPLVRGGEDVGPLDVPVLSKHILDAGVPDRGDLRAGLGADSDLRGAEQTGQARLDHVGGIAVGRAAETGEERAAGDAVVQDEARNPGRGLAGASGDVLARVEVEDPEAVGHELARGAGEVRLQELAQLAGGDGDVHEPAVKLGKHGPGRAVQGRGECGAVGPDVDGAAPEIDLPGHEGAGGLVPGLFFQVVPSALLLVKEALLVHGQGLDVGDETVHHVAGSRMEEDNVPGAPATQTSRWRMGSEALSWIHHAAPRGSFSAW